MMDSVYYFIRELPKSRIKRIYRLDDDFAGILYSKAPPYIKSNDSYAGKPTLKNMVQIQKHLLNRIDI